MTLECEPSSFDFTRTAVPPPPRLATMSTTGPSRGHDTLASLYKRYTTLNQQIRSTRLLLEQQQTDNQQTLALATARDRANGKLRRKLDQLSATTISSPDSSYTPLTPSTKADLQARKQDCASIQDEYQQWKETVQRHQSQLEKATFRTTQAQQQLLCLQQIHSTNQQSNQRYQDLEMRHALLDTLNAIRDAYVDSVDTMATRWAWLLVTDNDGNNTVDDDQQIATPAVTYMMRLEQLKQDYQHHLDQERVLQQKVDDLATAPDEIEKQANAL